MGKTNCLISQNILVNESYRRDRCEFFAVFAVKTDSIANSFKFRRDFPQMTADFFAD